MNGIPSFDEMRKGDIYAAGGKGGYDPSSPDYMDPTYTIPQPRDEVRSILDETGYTDMMLQKEAEKRKKHVEKIKKITGIKQIQGEDQFTRAADPERAKIWESQPAQDKMMVASLAEGKIQPQEYRTLKIQQEEQKKKQMLDFLKMASGGNVLLGDEAGKRVGISGKSIDKLLSGSGEVEAKISPKTTRHVQTSTSSRYGGGGSVRTSEGDIKERAQVQKEITATETQATNAMKEANKYLVIDPLTKQPSLPDDPKMLAKYQEKINEHYIHSIVASAQKRNLPANKARSYGEKVMNVSVAEDPNGGLVTYDNKLNIAKPEVKQALIDAIMNYESWQKTEGRIITAKDILENLKKREKKYLPDYGEPFKY